MRNVEFSIQEAMRLFMYVFFSILSPFSEILVSYMVKARTFRKTNLIEMSLQNIKNIIRNVVFGVTFAFNYLTRISIYTI